MPPNGRLRSDIGSIAPAALAAAPDPNDVASEFASIPTPITAPMAMMPLVSDPDWLALVLLVVVAVGTLLLAAGRPFRSRYLKRLEDLRSIDQAVEAVWIFEE